MVYGEGVVVYASVGRGVVLYALEGSVVRVGNFCVTFCYALSLFTDSSDAACCLLLSFVSSSSLSASPRSSTSFSLVKIVLGQIVGVFNTITIVVIIINIIYRRRHHHRHQPHLPPNHTRCQPTGSVVRDQRLVV